jgi:hypothetical protein
MTAPLARDQHGNAFDLPDEAEYWRPRRQTGGRPSPILGPDGAQAFIAVTSDLGELRALGCSGIVRLEAVDGDYRPVDAPVAFVDLGDTAIQRQAPPASNDNANLLRTSVEALARSVEAMQRAQVERERTLAQKERALTDGQVARDRMFTELLIALVNRSSDANTLLKQQLELRDTLDERGKRRNARALPAAPAPAPVEIEQENKPGWWHAILPFAPLLATTLQEAAVDKMADGDAAKAEQLRRNIANYAKVAVQFAAPSANAASAAPQVIEVDEENEDDEVENEDESDDRPTPPKVVRELMAQFDDDEASAFEDFMADLSDDEYVQLGPFIESRGDLQARLAWARSAIGDDEQSGILKSATGARETPTNGETAGIDTLGSLPPQLLPFLSQLSPDEQNAGLSILSALDRATIATLIDRLVAMAPSRALATIREIIADARRRTPSVAHRAVRTVLGASGTNEGDMSPPNGGAP